MGSWCSVRVEGSREGTGYLVSQGRVLTSLHLVDPDREVVVRGELPSGRPVSWKAKLLWPLDGSDVDVAVLEIVDGQTPENVTVLADRGLGENSDCRSEGFVDAFAPSERHIENLFPLEGRAFRFESSQRTFKVGVTSRPGKAKYWQGLSGSAVFVAGRLTGVIAKVDAKFPQTLKCASIPFLLSDEGFKQAVGWRPIDAIEQWTRMFGEIKSLLKQDSEAARAIAAELSAWSGEFEEQQAESLCLALCREGSFQEALDALFNAHQKISRSGSSRSRETIDELIAWVLPILSESEALGMVVGRGGAFLSLPIATASMAELVMAWLDGASYAFHAPSSMRRAARPKKLVDYPVETGSLVERGLAELSHEVLRRVQRDPDAADAEVVKWARKTLREALDVQDHANDAVAVQMVEIALDREAKQRRSHYLLFDRSFALKNRHFLDALAERLPSLRQVELTGGDDRAAYEYGRLLPLFELLYQAPEKRSRS